MAFATTTQFRLITAFKTTDISDADVTAFIVIADELVSKAFATRHHKEKLTGTIDSSNKYFYTRHKAIADQNADSDVTTSDLSVYYATYDTQNKIHFGTAVEVTAVVEEQGRIEVTTAPTSVTARAGVFCDYWSTVQNIDYDLIKLAATYLVAHLASFKIRGLAPDMSMTEATFLRRDVAGAPDEWLRMAIFMISTALGSESIGFRNVQTDLPDEIE